MPIRINLLEEEQKQKLARQRDPIKVAIRLAVVAVAAVLAYSLVLYARERSLQDQQATLTAEWLQCEAKFMKTEAEIKQLKDAIAKMDFLRSYVHNRFLWAPQLELYKDAIPNSIQLTRFLGRREVTVPAPPANPKAPPVFPMEMIKVTLEGIAEGNRPELVVQDFLTRLKSDPKLKDYIEEVKLASLTKSGFAANKSESDGAVEQINARFVIEIQYKSRPIKQT